MRQCVYYSAVLIIAVFFGWTVVGVSAAHASTEQASQQADVVASVNGVPIYRSSLLHEWEAMVRKYKISSTKFASKEAEQRQYRSILDKLITVELVRQAVHAKPVPDVEARMSERINELKSKAHSEEEFLKGLAKSNKNLDSLKEEVRETILFEEYIKRNKLKEVTVSDQEIEQYYKQNMKSFMNPEQIKTRHIIIAAEAKAGAEAAEKALQKAREVRERILKEKNFAEVAKEVSSCTSAAEGGDLGFIERGYMPAAFDKVAFELKPGEISEPVKTRFGYHIIEVMERKAESPKSLAEVKGFIAKYLSKAKEQEQMNAHVAELKRTAKIEISLK
ncbi:Foldase protein PrsA [Anaerolineales bacterium]|nr:Foldase protein PrsA [Anaerolineales bacterium]